MTMARSTVLLIQPRLGFSGHLIRHAPLSLVYAATETVERGYNVELLDLRLLRGDWHLRLRRRLARGDVLLVGLSAMTGIPLASASLASRVARRAGVPVVWGGPHPTVAPLEVLREGVADFVVRGYGSRALADLSDHLAGRPVLLDSVPGLAWLEGEELKQNPSAAHFERLHHRRLPYHLLDATIEKYVGSGVDRNFPLYTSHGCAGRCTFCISALLYRGFPRAWEPVPEAEVLDHIALLRRRWGINYFYLYDDDALVQPGHLLGVLQAAARTTGGLRFGFRGMRVDRLLRLKQEELALLARAGGHMLHVGVESGSDRVLEWLGKGIRAEQSVELNRRLAAVPGLMAAYNWLLAVPGERMEDLRQTRDLMLLLPRDNPRCIYFHPNRFIPLPGTPLYQRALDHGLEPPRSLAGWARLDNERAFRSPWLSPREDAFIDVLQLASYFLDGREAVLPRVAARQAFTAARALYRPMLLRRLRHEWTRHLWEMRALTGIKRAARAWWWLGGQ